VIPSHAGNPPSPQDLTELDLAQLMELEIDQVVGASLHVQRTFDAPAAVAVVSGDEIRAHGYRTLLEVLRGVTGLCTSCDRNYGHLGVRGFFVPGDYNARVLLLVDGHRVNDALYGGCGLNFDAPVDPDLAERIEVIRGPGSAIYGSNALFAVINVIHKRGADARGFEGASHDTYLTRATLGAGTLERDQLGARSVVVRLRLGEHRAGSEVRDRAAVRAAAGGQGEHDGKGREGRVANAARRAERPRTGSPRALPNGAVGETRSFREPQRLAGPPRRERAESNRLAQRARAQLEPVRACTQTGDLELALGIRRLARDAPSAVRVLEHVHSAALRRGTRGVDDRAAQGLELRSEPEHDLLDLAGGRAELALAGLEAREPRRDSRRTRIVLQRQRELAALVRDDAVGAGADDRARCARAVLVLDDAAHRAEARLGRKELDAQVGLSARLDRKRRGLQARAVGAQLHARHRRRRGDAEPAARVRVRGLDHGTRAQREFGAAAEASEVEFDRDARSRDSARAAEDATRELDRRRDDDRGVDELAALARPDGDDGDPARIGDVQRIAGVLQRPVEAPLGVGSSDGARSRAAGADLDVRNGSSSDVEHATANGFDPRRSDGSFARHLARERLVHDERALSIDSRGRSCGRNAGLARARNGRDRGEPRSGRQQARHEPT
jgi:hypothetical protein